VALAAILVAVLDAVTKVLRKAMKSKFHRLTSFPAEQLTPGVVLRMQHLQPFSGHMGVDGGGGNVGVSQQHLHGPQVCPMIKQMRSKGVAQGMW
jgi:hypothetical protein